jgi:hypothetical protein
MHAFKPCLFTVCAFFASGVFFAIGAAAQTYNPVASDSAGNTAMGTSALAGNDSASPGISANTAAGASALAADTSGSGNTAFGAGTLQSNEGGNSTAVGYQALSGAPAGSSTAVGYEALMLDSSSSNNTVGVDNAAFGTIALSKNSLGSANTAVGNSALAAMTVGTGNTAIGSNAIFSNGTGVYNTAVGENALEDEDTSNNTAIGFQALQFNQHGLGNTAVGYNALYYAQGQHNCALGDSALYQTFAAEGNIGLGYQAGNSLNSGSNNIDIGNPGGSSTEAGVIRIGALGTHTAAYIQGVAGSALTTASPAAVYADPADGQLGVIASSERFKTDVADMGAAASRLDDLRPVTFRLRADAGGTTQYGLIAEEVARVYPELVIRDAQGQASGVRYEELAPMLLAKLREVQARRIALARQLAAQETAESALAGEMQALHLQLARTAQALRGSAAQQIQSSANAALADSSLVQYVSRP